MFFYELYCDNSSQTVVSDVRLDDLPGKVEAVCKEMPLKELGGGKGFDWYWCIVTRFCDKYGCKRLSHDEMVDVDEIRQDIAYERGV